MAGRRALTGVQWAVGRDDQADEEEVDNVEDEDTPDDLFAGARDLLCGVLGLSRGESDELCAGVGEGSSNEDAAEAVETVEEG